MSYFLSFFFRSGRFENSYSKHKIFPQKKYSQHKILIVLNIFETQRSTPKNRGHGQRPVGQRLQELIVNFIKSQYGLYIFLFLFFIKAISWWCMLHAFLYDFTSTWPSEAFFQSKYFNQIIEIDPFYDKIIPVWWVSFGNIIFCTIFPNKQTKISKMNFKTFLGFLCT